MANNRQNRNIVKKSFDHAVTSVSETIEDSRLHPALTL